MTQTLNDQLNAYRAGLDAGRLLLLSCRSCGKRFHYPRHRCPGCLGDGLEYTEASGQGSVHAITQMSTGGDGSRLVAMVELLEGPRVTAAIVSEGEVSVGDTVVWASAEDVNAAGCPLTFRPVPSAL
ncbi:DNA-binding protein [Nocardioides marmoriginsengisoli]|uniref:DNA-binding protein n=1 Tax=Nocardioides marmoriginsengisoli TaxID=661483 RepID=A0A3N0CHU8_9ACTN|nr:zinc ribbon domain-containing protein [Nocardioides marmoriginsengisoli]RNL62889.1 DNA-binding protein [Nocardioides marmoriginsengisoli]